MLVKINDRNEFVTRFLSPIAKVSDSACVTITKDRIRSVVTNADNSVVLVAMFEHVNENISENITLNVQNVNRLINLLSCLTTKDVLLTITNNCIECVSDDVKFKYHLLDDDILKVPSINIQKIKELKFDTNFIVPRESIASIIKASSFTVDTEKIYIRTDGTKVVGELTDLQQANVDSFSRPVAMSYAGEPLNKPYPINFETIRMIGATRLDTNCDITAFVNHANSVFIFDISCETSKLKYITSAYAE